VTKSCESDLRYAGLDLRRLSRYSDDDIWVPERDSRARTKSRKTHINLGLDFWEMDASIEDVAKDATRDNADSDGSSITPLELYMKYDDMSIAIAKRRES
jgi:hypothetical protein